MNIDVFSKERMCLNDAHDVPRLAKRYPFHACAKKFKKIRIVIICSRYCNIKLRNYFPTLPSKLVFLIP